MSRPEPDAASRLVAFTTWLLPPGRRDWGRAMRAELAAIAPAPARRDFALGCLRTALWPAQLLWLGGYTAVVAGAIVLATLSRTAGVFRVEVIALGLLAPPVLWWLARRDASVGAVGPTRAARLARSLFLLVVAVCVVVAVLNMAVTMPREGAGSSSSGPALGLGVVLAFLISYTAWGLALTSAAAGAPAVTLAGGGGFGVSAGIAWCALMPFNQTLSVYGWSRVAGYAAGLALVAVGAPAAAAVLATRRTGDARQGALAGAGTGALAALVILAGGWTTVRLLPRLLDSPWLDKGPQWRPPDLVEQVIPSYLLVLVLGPLLGALAGWLAATAVTDGRRPLGAGRVAAVSALVVAGALVYPAVSAVAAGDTTAFGGVGSTAVVFSPAGGTLLTSNGDRTWILWNLADPARPTRLATFNDTALYSPDGHTLATRNTLWSLTGTVLTRTAQFDADEPAAFSPDGTTLATHRARGATTTTLWNVTNRSRPTRLGTLPTGDDGRFSPDRRTYVARGDTTTTLWDVADPARPARLATIPGGGRGPMSPDGTVLVAESGGDIVLWNVANPGRPARIGVLAGAGDPTDPGGISGRAVFSPDSRTVATGARDGSVLLWNTATALRTATLPPTPDSANNAVQIGMSDTLTTMAYAPDGDTLSVVTGNATVSVWDLTDPNRPVRTRTFTRITDGAGRVAFSPDTTTVAGAAVDGSNCVTMWGLR